MNLGNPVIPHQLRDGLAHLFSNLPANSRLFKGRRGLERGTEYLWAVLFLIATQNRVRFSFGTESYCIPQQDSSLPALQPVFGRNAKMDQLFPAPVPHRVADVDYVLQLCASQNRMQRFPRKTMVPPVGMSAAATFDAACAIPHAGSWITEDPATIPQLTCV